MSLSILDDNSLGFGLGLGLESQSFGLELGLENKSESWNKSFNLIFNFKSSNFMN